MDTTQLIRVLKKYKFTKRTFCGVIPIDKLPIRKIKRPCSFIINTDPSSLPGQHWVTIFVPRIGKIEYFDSYGRPPDDSKIMDFIKINGGEWDFNDKRIQGVQTITCGKFCVLYIAYRSVGISKKYFLNLFTNNLDQNEMLINHLFNKLYKRIH